jgi:hypothetical protein
MRDAPFVRIALVTDEHHESTYYYNYSREHGTAVFGCFLASG